MEIDKNINKQVARLMDVNMNRQEFLKYIAIVVLGVVGISNIIKVFKDASPNRVNSTATKAPMVLAAVLTAARDCPYAQPTKDIAHYRFITGCLCLNMV